jgi:hypothetical protein
MRYQVMDEGCTMEIGDFSGWINDFSVDKLISGDFSDLFAIFYLVISIAIYAIVIWHFYRFIARRDCFKISPRRHKKTIGFLKYTFAFPFVAFLFFAGFSLLLLFLTKNLSIDQVLSTSFAIIVAIRITAYYNEDLSKDVAKMLPFALLGLFLVDPSYFNWGTINTRISELPEFFTLMAQYILFIVLIEWILRMLLTLRYALIPKSSNSMDV